MGRRVCEVYGVGCRASGVAFRVWGFAFARFRVWGLGLVGCGDWGLQSLPKGSYVVPFWGSILKSSLNPKP